MQLCPTQALSVNKLDDMLCIQFANTSMNYLPKLCIPFWDQHNLCDKPLIGFCVAALPPIQPDDRAIAKIVLEPAKPACSLSDQPSNQVAAVHSSRPQSAVQQQSTLWLRS